MRSLTYKWKLERKQRRTGLLLYTFIDSFDSMPLLSIWLVIVRLFETSAAVCSFTGSRDVFHIHPTPQVWTASDNTVINGINESKFFPLFRQLWKNSRFDAVSTNGSESDLRYAVADVCWDNEICYLETGQVATRKGKPSNTFILLRLKLKVWKFFHAGQDIPEHTWYMLAVCRDKD